MAAGAQEDITDQAVIPYGAVLTALTLRRPGAGRVGL